MKRTLLLLALTLIAACAPQEHDVGEAGPQAGAAAVDVGVNEEALLALPCDPGRARLKWWLGTNYGCTGWNSIEVGTCHAWGKTFLADVSHIGTGNSGDFVVQRRFHLPPESQSGYHNWLKAKCTCTTSPAPQCVVTNNP